MTNKILHITNGSNLTKLLKELKIEGSFFTWQEMLCEGPTVEQIDSSEFINLRKSFFNTYYNIEFDEDEFLQELDKLNHIDDYSEIVLWFEYDLFCHINMVAILGLLKQKHVKTPISLVCSGRVKGEKDLKGLNELKPKQLLDHYKNKVLLLDSDIELASRVWRIYCGPDHNLLKPLIVTQSSFLYLSNCLKAHWRRFPNAINGLNSLEFNILKLIDNNKITSKHHLLGYALNYQGYYGYGDIQMERLINKLSIFFSVEDNRVKLNRKGHEVMLGQHNFASEINNDMHYGGVERLQYHYHRIENKLVKTPLNVN